MLKNINNKHKVIILFFVIFLICLNMYNNSLKEKRTMYILDEGRKGDEIPSIATSDSVPLVNTKIIVHIEGEVLKPGIYTLPQGARVIDAVEAAGGLKDTAVTKKVNLARKVVDEEFIYIPSKTEEEIQSPALNTIPLNGNNNNLININYADKSELEKLPGIGATLADRIIEYRNQLGPFKSIEDIKNVSGIGDKKYNDIKDKITVR